MYASAALCNSTFSPTVQCTEVMSKNMNPTVARMLDIYQQAVSRGEEVTLTMEKRGVCLSVRIPPGGGEQVETGNLDAGTKGALNSDHRDYSNRVKESPENLLNRQDSPLNKAIFSQKTDLRSRLTSNSVWIMSMQSRC